jgi:hypothetical protein
MEAIIGDLRYGAVLRAGAPACGAAEREGLSMTPVALTGARIVWLL